jgi:FAD/FMN-containing dehydrogenase
MKVDEHEIVKKLLIEAIGENKVLHNKTDLQAYGVEIYTRLMDENEKDRYFPDFAVLPETTTDVQKIVTIAAEHGIPLIPKGGGSNLVGMLTPIKGGIILDTIKMNKIIEIDVPNLSVTVQPGITLKELDVELSKHGLLLNQLQGSYKVATVGGSISTSGFSRKHNKYGTIADRIMSLEVVLGNGEILRTGPKVLYTSTGYRLHQLFIGAEGTLGVITEATLRVEPRPESSAAIMAFYDDFAKAFDVALQIKTSGIACVGLEANEIPESWEYEAPDGKRGVVIADFEGTKGEVEVEIEFVKRLISKSGGVLSDSGDAESYATGYDMMWCGASATRKKEERGDPLCAFIPTQRVMEFFDEVWNRIMPKYGITSFPSTEKCSLDVGRYEMTYGIIRILDSPHWHDAYMGALREVAELSAALGGSMEACHGVGLKYKGFMRFEYSEAALDIMREIKKIFDPKDIMNPMKKLPDGAPDH